MIKKKKATVCGVGINDADYVVQKFEVDYKNTYSNGKYKYKSAWLCPFYQSWTSMIKRCYSKGVEERQPTYKGCSVSEEWKLFSNFRSWMILQDWEGKELDKDILFVGNKIYSAEACVFVTKQVNVFVRGCSAAIINHTTGTDWFKKAGKFRASCGNPFNGKQEFLGYFACQEEAHNAWLSKKLEHAYALAVYQTDPRVAKALIDKYENYKYKLRGGEA